MLQQLHGSTRAKADQIATVGFDEQLFNPGVLTLAVDGHCNNTLHRAAEAGAVEALSL